MFVRYRLQFSRCQSCLARHRRYCCHLHHHSYLLCQMPTSMYLNESYSYTSNLNETDWRLPDEPTLASEDDDDAPTVSIEFDRFDDIALCCFCFQIGYESQLQWNTFKDERSDHLPSDCDCWFVDDGWLSSSNSWYNELNRRFGNYFVFFKKEKFQKKNKLFIFYRWICSRWESRDEFCN